MKTFIKVLIAGALIGCSMSMSLAQEAKSSHEAPIFTLASNLKVERKGVEQKVFEQKDLKDFLIWFKSTNQSDSVVNLDPIYRSSRLFINGKEESRWSLITMNGLRSSQFSALPAGKTDGFGCAMGDYFKKAGRYKIRWESSSFEPAEVEFVVKSD